MVIFVQLIFYVNWLFGPMFAVLQFYWSLFRIIALSMVLFGLVHLRPPFYLFLLDCFVLSDWCCILLRNDLLFRTSHCFLVLPGLYLQCSLLRSTEKTRFCLGVFLSVMVLKFCNALSCLISFLGMNSLPCVLSWVACLILSLVSFEVICFLCCISSRSFVSVFELKKAWNHYFGQCNIFKTAKPLSSCIVFSNIVQLFRFVSASPKKFRRGYDKTSRWCKVFLDYFNKL